MELVRHSRNVHELKTVGKQVKIAVLSDLHWDNPKCNRELLKQHLTTKYKIEFSNEEFIDDTDDKNSLDI